MSHLTHIKTRLQKLSYLEKTLSYLGIGFQKQKKIVKSSNGYNTNLIVSQSNNQDIQFVLKETEYEIITDINFWKQDSPIESFINKIAQQYSEIFIVGESRKIDFQLIKSDSNIDGSSTIILERWNHNKLFNTI